MLTIFRKSSNTNNFGQHQYWAADETEQRTLVFTATQDLPIGARLKNLNAVESSVLKHLNGLEARVSSFGCSYDARSWDTFMHSVVYRVTEPSRYAQWRSSNTINYKNNKHRMNPARRALMQALRKHGGYSTGYHLKESSCLDFDVSVYTNKTFGDYAAAIIAELPNDSPRRAQLAEHLPMSDAWWANTELEWEEDNYRWAFILEDMHNMSLPCEVEHYSINPVTGIKHDVDVQCAGREGKHLLVTKFDGMLTPRDLFANIMAGDRTETDSNGVPHIRQYGYNMTDGYTNEWMRNFATMVNYWNGIDIKALVRADYEHNEQYLVEQRIDDELESRITEHARATALDDWFVVDPMDNITPAQRTALTQ